MTFEDVRQMQERNRMLLQVRNTVLDKFVLEFKNSCSFLIVMLRQNAVCFLTKLFSGREFVS